MSCNGHQAHVDADGRVRVVVAHVDPGVPNWLDTEGRPIGMVVYRYVGAAHEAAADAPGSCPSPSCARALPADHPAIDADGPPTPARRPVAAPRNGAGAEAPCPGPRPTPPEWVDRLNAHGAAVGGAEHLVSLEPDDLLAAARRSHRPRRLRRRRRGDRTSTCSSTRSSTEADLTRRRSASWPAPSCSGRCASGCCSTALWAADPTILDEPIVEPVFVVGTGRSGTSILHELLALDPTNRTPRTWELLHPGEALGPDADTARRRRATTSTRSGPISSPRTSRCTTTTATSRTSASSPPCSSSSPTSGAAPTRCRRYSALPASRADQTEAYRYHRKVLQTLQRRERGATVGAQGAEPPRASCARSSRSTPTPGWSRSTATRSRPSRRPSA